MKIRVVKKGTVGATAPTELHMYDFDNTLFRSPLPPSWWSERGWWGRSESLSPPCVPATPDADWWNEDVVEKARESIADPSVLAVVITGRSEPKANFAERVPQLLAQKELAFDEVRLNPYGPTDRFKLAKLRKLLRQHPTIRVVHLWEDRAEHLEHFVTSLTEDGYEVVPHLVPERAHSVVCEPSDVGVTVAGLRYKKSEVMVMADFLETLITKVAPTQESQPWIKEWFEKEGFVESELEEAQAAVADAFEWELREFIRDWVDPDDVWQFENIPVGNLKNYVEGQIRSGVLSGKINLKDLNEGVKSFIAELENVAEYIDMLAPEGEEKYYDLPFANEEKKLTAKLKSVLVDSIKKVRKNLSDLAEDAVMAYNFEHEASVRVGTKKYRRKTAQSVVYDDRFFRWEGILFHVYALLRSKTGENLPGRDAGFTKQVKQIPKDIKGDVDAEKLVKAQEAADAGELWYIKIGTKSEGLGWLWSKGSKPNPSGASKVMAIHEVLTFLQRFSSSNKSSGAEAYYIEITNNTV